MADSVNHPAQRRSRKMKTTSAKTKRGRPRKYAHDLLPDVASCGKCPDPLSGECTGRCKYFTPIRFLVEKPKRRNKK